ncbi:MAG: T9SS type A sorting domain-containing protein [Bacteroidota bacterium]
MKKFTTLFSLKFTAMLFFSLLTCSVIAQSYNAPRSVVWDNANSRWLVSNTTGGTIVARSTSGTLTNFVTGLTSPRGICIMGSNLYVAEERNVKGFNLTTGAQTCNVFISVSTQLWDITSNGGTIIYVLDNGANKLYTVNPSAGTFTTPAVSGLSSPSGILFEMSNNRLVICSYTSNSPIQAISLSGWGVTTLATTTLSNLVGLSKDSQGNYYVSSDGDGNIYQYNSTFTTGPTSVAGPYTTPGDIFIKTSSDTLAIPLATSNQVVFVKLNPISVDEVSATSTFDIYPNPIANEFTVHYTLSKSALVQIDIFELTGRKVKLVNQNIKSAGEYEENFTVSHLGLSKGVYMLVMNIDDACTTKKLIIE